MAQLLNVLLTIALCAVVPWLISFYNVDIALVTFGLLVGFRFGQWYGHMTKEEDFIAREETIRSEYETKM